MFIHFTFLPWPDFTILLTIYFSCSLFNPRRLNIGPGRWERKDEMKTPLLPLMKYLVLGWSIIPLPNMNRLRGIQASPMGRMVSRRLDMCILGFLWAMSHKILPEFLWVSVRSLLCSSTSQPQSAASRSSAVEAASRLFSLCGPVLPKRTFTPSDTHGRHIQSPELAAYVICPSSKTQRAVWVGVSLWAQGVKYKWWFHLFHQEPSQGLSF